MEDREINLHIYRNALTIFNLFIFYLLVVYFDFDFLFFEFNKVFTELNTLVQFFILSLGTSILLISFNICRTTGILSSNFDFRVSPSGVYWNINKTLFILNYLLFLISFFVMIYRLFFV